MDYLQELKLHAEALGTAVEQNPKLFASVIHYITRLRDLLTDDQASLTKAELTVLTNQIEEFYRENRPSGSPGVIFIPPREIEDTDFTVREINRLVAILNKLDEKQFDRLRPVKHKPTPAEQQKIEWPDKGPCVFIGHGRSRLWARVQVFLQDEMGLATVTYESEPRTGESIVPVLEKMLCQATFAILVLTGEDATSDGTKRARQNVVHEAGLFQGRLGFQRAVLLVQDGIEEFTNVAGLQHIPFSEDRIEQTFYEVQRVLKREGQII